MKKKITYKILSILLALMITGIIPTSAVFADVLLADSDILNTDIQTVVNIATPLKIGVPYEHSVKIFSTGSGDYSPAAKVTGVVSDEFIATDVYLSDSGYENGQVSLVTILPTATGGPFSKSVTWSSDHKNLKKSVSITFNYTVETQTVPTVIHNWPSASNITYGQSLSASNLTGGSANAEGSFVFNEPSTKPNVGTASYSVIFIPSNVSNYNQVTGSVNVVTEKTNATLVVNGFTGTYDSLSHGAIGTAIGVNGEDLSSLLNLGSSYVNAPGGTANWIFSGDANYKEDSGSVGIVINKAKAIVTVSGLTVEYDGQEHGSFGSAKGLNDVDLSNLIDFGVKYINVPGGFAIWNFAGGINYENDTNTVKIDIAQATPSVTWPTASNIVYGQSLSTSKLEGGTASIDGSFKFDDPAIQPDAGTQTFLVKFIPTDAVNYKEVTRSIDVTTEKADPIIDITGYTGTYDGKAHGASGTVKGVKGEDLSSSLDFGASYTDFPGGDANWTFTGGKNYKDKNGTVNIVINKANAELKISGVTVDYDGLEHGATGTATGIDAVDLSSGLTLGAKFINVPGGKANWTFDGGINYKSESGSVDIIINQATPEVSWPLASVIIYGQSLADSNLTGGIANTEGLFVFDTPTFKPVAGTASYLVTFKPADSNNFKQVSENVSVVTDKADATITILGFTGTYDGQAHGASGKAIGAKGENLDDLFEFGTSFINVPGGTLKWSFVGDSNHNAADGTVEVVINQAAPQLTWPTAALKVGKDLGTAALAGGLSSVPGTFTFNEPSTIPALGKVSFNATFTPEDKVNYKTVSGKIEVDTTYNFSGVLQPINRDGSSVFKAGSTIPVKFQLFNFDGIPVSTAIAKISYVKITEGVVGAITEAVSTSAATTGNLFRYDTADQQYIFNLSTKGFKAGTYELRILLDDGTTQSIKIGLK